MMKRPSTADRSRLKALIEAARQRGPMTAAERYDQRISFAYGQVSIENPKVTRKMVEDLALEIYGPRPAED